jgi:hypothetical protein
VYFNLQVFGEGNEAKENDKKQAAMSILRTQQLQVIYSLLLKHIHQYLLVH